MLDTLGLHEAWAAVPERCRRVVASARGVAGDLVRSPNGLVLVGAGAGAVAAEAVLACAGPFFDVPVAACEHPELPGWVDARTLVVALSWSGDDGEVLLAATEAASRGAAVVAVTRGGQLGELAPTWGSPVIRLAPGSPAARSAVAELAAPVLVLAGEQGWVGGAEGWVGAALAQLIRRRENAGTPRDPVGPVATRLRRTMPLVVGAGALGSAAARGWASQIRVSAKSLALHAAVPPASHDLLAAFGQHGDITRQVLTLVVLRHDHEHPLAARRLDALVGWLDEVVVSTQVVTARGDGPFAQLIDLLDVGEGVALALAAAEDLDPGPAPVLDDVGPPRP